ncbi:prephenate dehydrogenase, putative [Ricinus communis]|uniref:Prephenate dehydrogenase, putative n=1 Tax=Ricinus communis TaxID=3988 RepID=B9S487_RICCO|nr:prephenate dehydrogenase, putative [Ricinus communis]
MSPPPSSTTRRSLKIGIIGFGRFGQFLAKTMIKQGHTLRATSRSDHSHLCEDLGISYFRDVIKFLEADNDVILICTSILSLQEVLNSMPLHSLKRQRTLFADVLSVKEYPRDVLTKVLPEESDILCTHPMFGPESGKHGWKDLAFVYDKVRVRDEATCSSFLKIFETEGCRMLEMSCEEHDRMAAKSQFLTHTIGRIFSEMEIKSTPMSTKGFETLVRLKDDTTKDSFDLFSGLFLCNRFAKQELKNLELALEKKTFRYHSIGHSYASKLCLALKFQTQTGHQTGKGAESKDTGIAFSDGNLIPKRQLEFGFHGAKSGLTKGHKFWEKHLTILVFIGRTKVQRDI